MERYPDSFIQQIKDKSDIVNIVSNYVSLQKKGRDYWACCPFHHEKTPSFQVKSYHQYYCCYGCGKKGDVINFVMEMDKLSFNEAIENLAQKLGLDLPKRIADDEYIKRKKELEKIYAVNRESAIFYHKNLLIPEGDIALQYCAERQLTKSTIIKFGIGYSYDYTSLIKYLKSKGYSVESMRAAGVIGTSDDGNNYDFFAKRLIIPIISSAGKVLGFTGRSLDKTKDMKYKNTSTTIAFNKRKSLFGINMFKQYAPTGSKSMILVEGHMDVISLFQYGITNVVASMGTSLTTEQCREIKRYADKVYVSFDGDSAGQSATLRGLSLLKDENLEVYVVQLTNNLDPDDYIKKFGKDEYLKLVDNALPLIDFKLKKIEEKYTFNSYDERVKYVKEAVKELKEMDEIERAIYIKKVCSTSGINMERIDSILQSAKIPYKSIKNYNFDTAKNNEVKETSKTELNAIHVAECFVLSSMIFGKSFAHFGDVFPEIFASESHKKICDYIIECAKESHMPIASKLFDLTDSVDAGYIIEIIDSVKIENQPIYYEQCIKKMKKTYADKKLKTLIEKLNAETNDDEKLKLKKQILELTQFGK